MCVTLAVENWIFHGGGTWVGLTMSDDFQASRFISNELFPTLMISTQSRNLRWAMFMMIWRYLRGFVARSSDAAIGRFRTGDIPVGRFVILSLGSSREFRFSRSRHLLLGGSNQREQVMQGNW